QYPGSKSSWIVRLRILILAPANPAGGGRNRRPSTTTGVETQKGEEILSGRQRGEQKRRSRPAAASVGCPALQRRLGVRRPGTQYHWPASPAGGRWSSSSLPRRPGRKAPSRSEPSPFHPPGTPARRPR